MIRADTNSVVRLQNATVIGGNLQVRNGGQVQLAASTLTTVSIDTSMATGVVLRTVSGSNQIFSSSLSIPYNSQWVIGDGTSLLTRNSFDPGLSINNQGTILLNGVSTNGAYWRICGTGTLTGGGTVILGCGGTSHIAGICGKDWLFNDNNTIRGAGEFGPGLLGILNSGTIVNDCPGGTLRFSCTVENNLSIVALNGGVLDFYGMVINNGIIDARDGIVRFHDHFINNGTILTADSIPEIVSVSMVDPDFCISFTTGDGNSYAVEYTADLVSGSWTTLTNITGTGGTMIATDPGAASLPSRFYRVRLLVP